MYFTQFSSHAKANHLLQLVIQVHLYRSAISGQEGPQNPMKFMELKIEQSTCFSTVFFTWLENKFLGLDTIPETGRCPRATVTGRDSTRGSKGNRSRKYPKNCGIFKPTVRSQTFTINSLYIFLGTSHYPISDTTVYTPHSVCVEGSAVRQLRWDNAFSVG